MLSVSALYKGDDGMVSECEVAGGMNIEPKYWEKTHGNNALSTTYPT
jgi:hypothetical protein